MQVAPFSQSWSSQSSVLLWQAGPSKPSGHLQLRWRATDTSGYFQNCKDCEILKLVSLTCTLPPPPRPLGRFLRWRRGCSRRRSEPSHSSCPETEHRSFILFYFFTSSHLVTSAQTGAHLKSWWTAAPVDLHQVTVTDALVQAGTGQTGVTLGQDLRVHISCGGTTKQ